MCCNIFKYIMFLAMLLIYMPSLAATDGAYTLSEVSAVWDGTQESQIAPVTTDYNVVYGDDTPLVYTLPWTFFFYGHGYNKITVDTNGSIWFAATTSAHEFNLAKSNRGLVIAPWNYDLSSVYEGGVFIQHKTGPERVVIEWRAETYSDEGAGLPNVFEAVLFADGTVRFDYKSFTAVNAGDSGSGISKDDGTYFLSTTTTYGNAYVLAGRSFKFIPSGSGTIATLSVNFNGTGNGWVTSSPAGLACNADCYADFPLGPPVTLHAAASPYSYFTGWSGGGCSGLGDCAVTLLSNTLVNANFMFDAAHKVRADGGGVTYYTTIQAAYNAIPDASIIKLWSTEYAESLTCSRPVTVTLQGGYDEGYSTKSGKAVLNGTLTVTNGTVVVDGIIIR